MDERSQEIVVTSEMIAAGAEALSRDSTISDLADGWAMPSEVVETIYRAMEEARRKATSRRDR